MITVNILENGNAELTISGNDQTELAELLQDGQRCRETIFAELFEQYSCNGSYTPIYNYGLTSAPAFVSEMDYPDNGDCVPAEGSELYWFPDYAVRDELQELAELGRVVFIKAD